MKKNLKYSLAGVAFLACGGAGATALQYKYSHDIANSMLDALNQPDNALQILKAISTEHHTTTNIGLFKVSMRTDFKINSDECFIQLETSHLFKRGALENHKVVEDCTQKLEV